MVNSLLLIGIYSHKCFVIQVMCNTITRKYNYQNFGHYPSSCLSFRTQLNSVGLSIPHRNHITSPLRVQQVNAIYRFVAMVHLYIYLNSGHYP
jgi:hypothetical protein